MCGDEKTVGCRVCGASYCADGLCGLFVEAPCANICVECAHAISVEYQRLCEDASVCRHGVDEGDWCEDCNREYKTARFDPANGNGDTLRYGG